MQTVPITIKEFRDKLSTYFGHAVYGHEPIKIKKYGDVGVLISEADFEEYQHLLNPRTHMTQAEWDASFAVVDELRSNIPHFSSEEVEQDIAQAVAEVRATKHQKP